ncbi:MAG TPA: AAA family ATPase [Allosphingosinicella sp.]|jgi:AAA+ superfamily predicted ATPase
MGEKLLAKQLLVLLRDTTGRKSIAAQTLLDWAQERKDWLWPNRKWPGPKPRRKKARLALDWDGLPALAAAIDTAEPEPPLFELTGAASRLLDFDRFEAVLLNAVAGLARLPRLSALRRRLADAGVDMLPLLGRLAGAADGEAAGRVRRSGPVSLGLLRIDLARGGGYSVDLDWTFSRVLDGGWADEAALIDALAGIRQSASLGPEDFAEHRGSLDLLERLLRGALDRQSPGIGILIHGPPGTGKTEFARTLAAAAGAELFAVGECGEDGEEPTRWERLHALKRAERLLARRGGSVLLFDEMEDLFSDASHTADGDRRAGSKIFVNRLLEEARVPVIWTSNALDGVDPAHLRRMSFILRMDHPSPSARARIARRAAEAEGVAAAAAGLGAFLPGEPESASVARAALRTAALAGGGAMDAEAAAQSLLLGLRGGRSLPPAAAAGALDLALYDSETAIAPLVERVSAPGAASDFSLLLTGPPGTGKTALAAHLAERLDRPLRVRRASDLLSKWVGGTESNIAEAFAEARDQGAVLLFDEADSLLLDRSDAQRSWEITQVNEMLTWMDCHPLPFVAATNFARRLDPAALRRFVFKIELKALSADAAARAFERFFGKAAPARLSQVAGLTPGDFAVVRRQLRYRPEAGPGEIVALLEAEAKAKPERVARIGF